MLEGIHFAGRVKTRFGCFCGAFADLSAERRWSGLAWSRRTSKNSFCGVLRCGGRAGYNAGRGIREGRRPVGRWASRFTRKTQGL